MYQQQIYGEFILLIKPAEMKDSENDIAYHQPANIIIEGCFPIVVPFPIAQFNGYGLHYPVEENGNRGAVNNNGNGFERHWLGLCFSGNTVDRFHQQGMNADAAAIDDHKPIDADDDWNFHELIPQYISVSIVPKERPGIDPNDLGRQPHQKCDSNKENEEPILFFLCPH